jgi:hypothetical protein
MNCSAPRSIDQYLTQLRGLPHDVHWSPAWLDSLWAPLAAQ